MSEDRCICCGGTAQVSAELPGSWVCTPGGWYCQSCNVGLCRCNTLPADSGEARRCWVLMRPDGTEWDNGDYAPHFDTQQKADDEASHQLLDNVKVEQLDQPCLIVHCGCCNEIFDEEGEGHTVHFDSRSDMKVLVSAEWTEQVDGSWRCLACSPGGDCDDCKPAAHEQDSEVSAR